MKRRAGARQLGIRNGEKLTTGDTDGYGSRFAKKLRQDRLALNRDPDRKINDLEKINHRGLREHRGGRRAGARLSLLSLNSELFSLHPVGVRNLLSFSTQCALRDTGLWSGTALQFIPVWPSLMCFPVLCSRGPTRQPHRNRGVKPLLQLKTFTLEPASEAGPFSFSLFFDQDQDQDQDQD